jgi:hypothetical protein
LFSSFPFSNKFKFKNDVARKHTVMSHTNAPLQYITRGQLNICMTLIEKLRIAPFVVEMVNAIAHSCTFSY